MSAATQQPNSQPKPQPKPLPQNWPSNIPYLTRPLYSPYLSPSHLTALRTRPPHDPSDPIPDIPRDLTFGPSEKVRIEKITDPKHPAYGQAGLFATRDLKPGELILPYLGEVHVGTEPFGRPEGLEEMGDEVKKGNSSTSDEPTKASSSCSDPSDPSITYDVNPQHHKDIPPSDEDPNLPDHNPLELDPNYDYAHSNYDLWLSRPLNLAIDASRAGNEARFINDYRGVPLPLFPTPSSLINSTKSNKTKSKNDPWANKRKRPNAEFKLAWDPRIGELCMAVYVLRAGRNAKGWAKDVGILRGEEVLVSYGKGFWRERKGEQEGEGNGQLE